MEDSFTTLLGYTEEEILKYFSGYLKHLAESQSLSIQETLAKIKYWYNGYRFSKKDIRVYNPWSLMSALEKKDFLSVNVNSEIIAISRSINSGDLNKFFSLLKSYFASIPYELIDKKRLNEKYFQLLFYLLMRVTGFMVNTEDRTSSGRIDMVLEASSKIYLLEFKVNSTARLALEQIKEKKYYEKYENVEDKKLLLVGINFDLNSKNISETEVLEWN